MKQSLGVVDYVVIAATLLISAAIGIIIKFTGDRQRTATNFLMAGKNMPMLPVVLSIVVTMTTAVGMLGTSSELYRYGTQMCMRTLVLPIGLIAAAYVFVPVYFQCNVTTVYELLEMRFGKITRRAVSTLFVLQMIGFMTTVLFAPALALNAVSDLSFVMSILVIGAVCTFYCAIGGLKAVLWTDTFQALMMLVSFSMLYISGISEAGGIANVYDRLRDGNRTELFNFDTDLTARYTFWNTASFGILHAFGCYGTSQIEVQRLLSMSTMERAKSALLMSIGIQIVFHLLCNLLGAVLYAVFYDCDPVMDSINTGLTKYDQLVPYYIVTRFSDYPGLTGLCMAGIFSGSLSTLSSGFNSLATVTVVDFVQPIFPSYVPNEARKVLLSRVMSVLYGFLCMGMSFLLLNSKSIMQATHVFFNALDGPIAAVFTVGVLSTKGTEKSVLTALALSSSFVIWISFGSLISGFIQPYLPLSTSGCDVYQNATVIALELCKSLQNCTSTSIGSTHLPVGTPWLHKISFLWLRPLGFCLCLIVIFFMVLITERNKKEVSDDSKYLSPIRKLWIKKISA